MIRMLRPDFPLLSVHRMCALLTVPRSLYYRVPAAPEPLDILKQTEQIVMTHLGYGYRRVLRELRRSGLSISEYAVRRFLRENGLMARRPKSRGVTRASLRCRRAANLIKAVQPQSINEIWGADITQIQTEAGCLYLAVMLDLHSRRVVGWSLSRRCDEALAASCLKKALESRRPGLGWIHHSDQGSVYTASGYCRLIRDSGGRLSFSAPGRPRDNAFVESFFRTLKLEEADRNRYLDFLEAESSIRRYIEDIYNALRMHSALGYMSPDQYESQMHGAAR